MPKKPNSSYIIPGGKLNNYLNNISGKFLDYKKSKKIYLIILIAGILLLATYKRSWFVAATVNGQPIINLELQMRLNQQFKSQMLSQIINEKIILDEAAKNGVMASEDEVSKKISEVEASVGGADALNTLLSQQGQTRDTIRQQIKVQLSIGKLYANEATISADEVSKFIQDNKDTLRATDSAGQVKEATDTLKQQKLSQIFSQKFQNLRQKANIKIF